MTQFHEGQEVEVYISNHTSYDPPVNKLAAGWRKAKIVCPIDPCEVKFPDGTRAVFDAEHIRAVSP